MKKLIYDIKNQSKILEQNTDEELQIKIEKFKKQIEKEYSKKQICEWFSLVQEISFRTIGLRHFDTQLAAGFILNDGNIVEMKTGEGKTLVSTLPVSLNALSKKGVHVVTVNEYLAERDQKWMGKIYNQLGLSVGLIKSTNETNEKQKSYNADITYVTNSELVFDYLRDSSAYNVKEVVQRPFNYCLIDEIDSILIDEARTPLIISTASDIENERKLFIAQKVATFLQKDLHFEVDEKRKDIFLTETGYEIVKKKLGTDSLYDTRDPWILILLNALKANYLFKLNKDYIILKNKVVIVDEFTGRIMEDRRWSMGLHEAVEMKENVKIGNATKTKTTITYQNFFPLYPKLAGMTGTGKTTEKEFEDIYKLKVFVLETAKPMVRKDLPDLVYQSELSKWKAVLEQSKKCYENGQPILIGTSNIEKSEFLSDLFKISNIKHQVLNAKPENVNRESEIVAEAGERFAVTIATNMAGRGTDIILGGNPQAKVKQKLIELIIGENKEKQSEIEKELVDNVLNRYKNNKEKLVVSLNTLPYSLEDCEVELKALYNYFYKSIYGEWEKENKKIKELGGLFVLGTERHETRRIDNQLRGRAGRQGDPGISQFFVSLEDDLIKVFGGDSIRRWVGYLMDDKDSPLESNLLTNSLENAQKKIEMYNYDLRKNVFQYDDILNLQRKQLFNARKELLSENKYDELILRFSESFLDKEIKRINNSNEKLIYDKLETFFGDYFTYSFINKKDILKEKKDTLIQLYKELWISYDLRYASTNCYQSGFLKNTRSTVLLEIIDEFWTKHLERMGYIRETINWRSYGQQNPLLEYNKQAFKSFKLLFEDIRSSMVYYILSHTIFFY